MSSAPSSTPDPIPPPVKPWRKSNQARKALSHTKAGTSSPENAKNEGLSTSWVYEPPPGAVLLDQPIDAAEFDWDVIDADSDCELCLIRIPNSLKAKYLERVKVDVQDSISGGSARVGTIIRKHATFDIWSIGDDDKVVGGEEIKRLTCLLPRKSEKGKLYPAPKPIARHLIISARPVQATVGPRDGSHKAAALHQNPARESHPKELLKHRFMPYGSLAPPGDDSLMDLDVQDQQSPITSGVVRIDHEASSKDVKKLKGKKRKAGVVELDQSGPKKSKKAKSAS